MLEPDSRAVLTEQLRPPTGFRLNQAVATTFTLDLISALSIPLAFASHRLRESDSPIAILDAVRRESDRIDVFAQAGQISAPSNALDLVAFLEPMIHPVTAPRPGALFHPKVWVLEYTRGAERSYRLISASRNLTADRSWDLIVRLDGEPSDTAIETNEPLARFVGALPAMGVMRMPQSRIDRIEQLARRIRTVEWERPEHARRVTFVPLGVPGVESPHLDELFDGKRHLIISPFLSDEGLNAIIPKRSRSTIVVSRKESIERLQPAILKRLTTYTLDESVSDDEVGIDRLLVGLHAKAYVLDRREGSHLIVGSANATGAAFAGNVEMLIDFLGPDTKLGVGAIVGEDTALHQMLVPFETEGGVEAPANEVDDHRLEREVRRLSTVKLRATVRDRDDAYALEIDRADDLEPASAFEAKIQLLTRRGNTYPLPPVASGVPLEIDGLQLTDITPFFVLSVTDQRGETKQSVLVAELIGDIDGRRDAIVAQQISTREAFMQLLALLLAFDVGAGDVAIDGLAGLFGGWGADGGGLFEPLVRAVGSAHGGLADAKRIIDQLVASAAPGADGQPILPEGFTELWDSVWHAHLKVTEGAR